MARPVLCWIAAALVFASACGASARPMAADEAPRAVEVETEVRAVEAPPSPPAGPPVVPETTERAEQHAVVILTEAAPEEDGIDDLLGHALENEGHSSASADGSASSPSRAEVVAAMSAIRPELDRCASAELDGAAQLRMSFAGSSGAVREVTVLPESLPDELRRCLAEAARRARVPPFRSASFAVSFPARY